MEVHPPERAIHCCRDFFVHMGTITLGLLIAIGLERTVEHLHHSSEVHRLEEALQADNQIIVETSSQGAKSRFPGNLYLSPERAGAGLIRPLPHDEEDE